MAKIRDGSKDLANVFPLQENRSSPYGKKSGKFEIFVAVLTRRTLIFLQGKCEQKNVRPVWGYIILIPPNRTDPFLFLLEARKRNFCLIFVPNKNGTNFFAPSRILGGRGCCVSFGRGGGWVPKISVNFRFVG